MTKHSTLALSLPLVAIAAYFLYFSGDGIHGYFTGDDGMNLVHMHGYPHVPLLHIAGAAVAVFTPTYRPVGGLFYRIFFPFIGYHPMGFRLACFALLLLNLWLAFAAFQRIAGRRTALVATAIFCFHGALVDLYWSTGTIYDVLCFTFYLAGLLLYLRARDSADLKGWIWFAAALAMFGFAIGSKEMALTFPAILVGLEALRMLPAAEGGAKVILLRLGLAGSMGVIALIVKAAIPNELSNNPLYQIHTSPLFLWESYRHYSWLLFVLPHRTTSMDLALGFGALIGAGLLLRSRAYWFGLLWLIVTFLPVAVVAPRSGFVMYLPYWGLALCLAAALTGAGRWIGERLPLSRPIPELALVVLVLAALLPFHRRAISFYLPPVATNSEKIRTALESMRFELPYLKRGARLFLTGDPFEENDWTLLFLSRLQYGDPSLLLDRQKLLGGRTATELGLYDYVGSFEGDRLKVIKNSKAGQEPLAMQSEVAVLFQPQRVRPGDSYRVQIPGFENRRIDVAYSLIREGKPWSSGIVTEWCRLDAKGSATLKVPADHPITKVVIERVRAGGDWLTARGYVEVGSLQ